jgi:hypothetical protein
VLIIFLIRRVPWRHSHFMIAVRHRLWSACRRSKALRRVFCTGSPGGASLGRVRFSDRRTTRADPLTVVIHSRWLGTLLAPVVATSGVAPLWISLVAFTAVALALLPLLDRYAIPASDATGADGEPRRGPWFAIALGCAALFVYQRGGWRFSRT